MLLRTLRRLYAGRFAALRPAGALAVLATACVANAQYYGGYDPCNPCQTVCHTVCQQTAMVVQPAYQTVPVTEYQEVKQTVMRPVTETRYEEREYTEYRPITETKTAEIPVTTYTPVTEMQTVLQDRSFYATRYVPNCRVSPCQYDPRPGLFGWMNRTGYELRSAFTPRYSAYREYVPNQVAMQVPITRQIAQQGTRQVTYNVTRYEPHTATRQVAINETKWVAEEHTVSRPVTTYRTVPVGTTVAYAPVGGAVAFGGGTITNVAYGPIRFNGSGTGLAAVPDPISTRSAQTIRPRTATAAPAGGKPATGQPYERKSTVPADPDFGADPSTSVPRVPKFRKFTAADRERILSARRLARTDDADPAVPEKAVAASHETFKPVTDEAEASEPALVAAFERPTRTLPSAVRSVRWTPAEPSGPELIAPSVAAVD
jgi:hypothetical protein